MNAQAQVQNSMNLPAPLTVARDMRARWDDIDSDFDTAAQSLVSAHENDGRRRDVPLLDLRTWGLKSQGSQFALAPLAGHEPSATRSDVGCGSRRPEPHPGRDHARFRWGSRLRTHNS